MDYASVLPTGYNIPVKRGVSKYTADDGDVLMVIRYKGSLASGLIAVDAGTGDISSTVGALGAEAADANFTVGATPGTIDVSNAAVDTIGELVDFIDGLDDYDCWLVAGLRADDSDAAGRLITISATQAKTENGLELKKDSSTALNFTLAIRWKDSIGSDDKETVSVLQEIISLNTYTGTSTIQVYEINPIQKTETLVRAQAGGLTTAEQTINLTAVGEGGLYVSRPGNYLIVRMIGSAACTGYLDVRGLVYKK